MSRKAKRVVEPLPKVGDVRNFWNLPRDVRLGVGESTPPGTALVGWCENTETRQLLILKTNGDYDATAQFAGFVKDSW